MDSSDIIQIVEFGHNPSQLFEKAHSGVEGKLSQSLFDPLSESQSYTVTYYKQKESKGNVAIRVMGKEKQNLITINSKHELMKRSLTSSKTKYNIIEHYGSIQPFFNIYNQTKEVFNFDPSSAFILCEKFLFTCRNKMNLIEIYNPFTLELTSSINFHKVF